jgi:hypothetical protein
MSQEVYIPLYSKSEGCDDQASLSKIEKLQQTLDEISKSHGVLIQQYQEEARKLKATIRIEQYLLLIWAMINLASIFKLLYDYFH